MPYFVSCQPTALTPPVIVHAFTPKLRLICLYHTFLQPQLYERELGRSEREVQSARAAEFELSCRLASCELERAEARREAAEVRALLLDLQGEGERERERES